MQKDEVHNLIEKYLHNKASQDEIDLLFQWYGSEIPECTEWDLDDSGDEEHLKAIIFSRIAENGQPGNSGRGKRFLLSGLFNKFR